MDGRKRSGRVLEQLDEAVRRFTGRPDGSEDPRAALEREAFARGRQRGFDEGARGAAAELERKIDEVQRELAATLERLAAFEEKRQRENAALVTELALAAAARIVRGRIDAGDPVAARALAEAVEALPPAVKLRARVHPDDVEAVAREFDGETGGGRLKLVPDRSIARGGCIVQSDAGTIDATIDTAMDALRDAAGGEMEAR